MSVQLIERSAWRAQAWQNGGGVTHEVAREEDTRGLLWRLSVAEVAKDGPFSPFEGLDRVIALLEGKGFSLSFSDGRQHRVASPREPYAFAGEEAPHCTLVAGPVLDWNLMTRRAELRARVEALTVSGRRELPGGATLIVFCASGSAQLEASGTRVLLSRYTTAIVREPRAALEAASSFSALVAELAPGGPEGERGR